MRLSLACWRREAWAERPERPLSVAPKLGGKGTWAGVGRSITVVSEVAGALAWSRTWGGDGGGTISGSAVDVEMSAAKAVADVGGAFPSSDVIIRGWAAWSRPEAAG